MSENHKSHGFVTRGWRRLDAAYLRDNWIQRSTDRPNRDAARRTHYRDRRDWQIADLNIELLKSR